MRPTPVRASFVLIAVSALPGSLDLTFGSNGWTIVDFDTPGDEPFGAKAAATFTSIPRAESPFQACIWTGWPLRGSCRPGEWTGPSARADS